MQWFDLAVLLVKIAVGLMSWLERQQKLSKAEARALADLRVVSAELAGRVEAAQEGVSQAPEDIARDPNNRD